MSGEVREQTDLATWLLACVEDDQRKAMACLDVNMRAKLLGGTPPPRWVDDGTSIRDAPIPGRYDTPVLRVKHTWVSEQDHITNWDPARVLAECDAKRRIIDLHVSAGKLSTGDDDLPESWHDYCKTCGSGEPYEYPTWWPCETLRLMAAVYADRPGYRADEWSPDRRNI